MGGNGRLALPRLKEAALIGCKVHALSMNIKDP